MTGPPPRVVVTAFGRDRPGIVSAVTGVLVDRGANLADTAMTNLAGQFAMVLVVEVPVTETATALEEELAARTTAMGLTVSVRGLPDEPPASEVEGARRSTPWAVSVHGADRPGIVHQVSHLLAELGANVVDLTTRTVGTPEEPVYVMLLAVDLAVADPPAEGVGAELERRLALLAEELGVDIHLRAEDPDVF